ncbi:MAG: nucleotidyl transferase AbiEii/AbiGii toxin family protein [Nitrosotalea sp.]
MVSLREARQAAAKTGIGLQYVMKEARVFDIWAKISPAILSSSISDHATIICKGGTPINKIFFGRVQRFSEDIDMDIFFKKKVQREDKIRFIKENIISLLESSYTIPKEARRRNIIVFFCQFQNEQGIKDNIQLDFNIGESRTGQDEIASAKSAILPLSIDRVPVYSLDTLIAKKFKAFYERDEGKDVYDLYYGLRQNSNPSKIIPILKDVLKSARIDYDEFSDEVKRKLGDKALMSSLRLAANPYIPKGLRIDFVKASDEISKKIVRHL